MQCLRVKVLLAAARMTAVGGWKQHTSVLTAKEEAIGGTREDMGSSEVQSKPSSNHVTFQASCRFYH